MTPGGLGGGIGRVVRHCRSRVVADVNEGIVFVVNGDRCKGVHGKSMDV